MTLKMECSVLSVRQELSATISLRIQRIQIVAVDKVTHRVLEIKANRINTNSCSKGKLPPVLPELKCPSCVIRIFVGRMISHSSGCAVMEFYRQ
jgi:hypothetical protein